MKSPLIGSFLLSLTLSSCFSLGQQALPDAPDRPQFEVALCTADKPTTAEPPLTVQVKQLPVQTLSTAKSPWDTHLRYVYPFTQQTVQFEVNVQNKANAVLHLDETVQLVYGDSGQSMWNLPLAFFEKAWPTAAVRDAQQLHDRSMAMGEVLEKQWTQRALYPQESYRAWVSFPASVLTQQPQSLTLTYGSTVAVTTPSISLCFSPVSTRK